MDFSFSSEQTLLQDSVERFIQNDYGFDQRQKLTGSELGFSKEHWSHFAELGWLGLPFAEEDGGFGGSAIDTMLVMEHMVLTVIYSDGQPAGMCHALPTQVSSAAAPP